jgi:hypothetical protein
MNNKRQGRGEDRDHDRPDKKQCHEKPLTYQTSQLLPENRGVVRVNWRLQDGIWRPRCMTFYKKHRLNLPHTIITQNTLVPPITRKAVLAKQGRCQKCGNSAGGDHCLRRACLLYNLLYVNGSYYHADEAAWCAGTSKYVCLRDRAVTL